MTVNTKKIYNYKSKLNSRKYLNKSRKNMINMKLISNKSKIVKSRGGYNNKKRMYSDTICTHKNDEYSLIVESESEKLLENLKGKDNSHNGSHNDIHNGSLYIIDKNKNKIKLYSGEFKLNNLNNNLYFIYHGFGTEYYKNGNPKYIGDWKDNKAHGDGIYYNDDNHDIKYNGSWKCNRPSGKGIKKKNEKQELGVWTNLIGDDDNCMNNNDVYNLNEGRVNLVDNQYKIIQNTQKKTPIWNMAKKLEQYDSKKLTNINKELLKNNKNFQNLIKYRTESGEQKKKSKKWWRF